MYLAAKGAEGEGIEEGSMTDKAGIGDSFAGPGLGPLVEEHYLGAVYNVCLNPCNVHILLNLPHPYHIMV